MSYDVYLVPEEQAGLESALYLWERNHTSNTSPIWRAAGCDVAEFDGRRASELGPAAVRAVAAITADPDKYRPMEPENGWGTVASTVCFLAEIWQACSQWPEATVRVSR